MPVLTNRMWQKKLYCWGWGPRALRLSHFPCLGYTTLEARIPVRSVTTLRLAHPKEAQAAMWPPGGCEVPDICLEPSGTSSPGGPLTPCLWAANPSQGCLGQSYSAHPCWILDTYNCEQFRVAIFKPLCFGIAGYTVIDNKNNWLTPPTVFPQGKFTRKPNHLMNERIRAEKMFSRTSRPPFPRLFSLGHVSSPLASLRSHCSRSLSTPAPFPIVIRCPVSSSAYFSVTSTYSRFVSGSRSPVDTQQSHSTKMQWVSALHEALNWVAWA